MNRTILPVTAFLLLQPQAQSLSTQGAVSRPAQAEIYSNLRIYVVTN